MPESQTALKYYQPAHRVLIQDTPSGTPYVFTCKANITMAWVNDTDVEHVLSRYKVCCGGHRRAMFSRATESDIRQWTNGGGR